MSLNIAILSPARNSYSETFIQSHRRNLKGKTFYYYSGFVPMMLDGQGPLLKNGNKPLYFFRQTLLNSPLNTLEQALKASFKKNKIDVALAEYGPTALHSFKTLRASDIPYLIHFHGYDAHRKDVTDGYKKEYEQVFSFASGVIAVSQYMKKALIALGCPEEKITLATYGPNERFMDIQPTFKQKQFVAVGRFVDKKAPYFTIIAFKEVLKKHPDAKLVMIGDGALKNTCQNLINYWGLNNNIQLAGILKPEEIADLFSNSLAFVQHSMVAESGDSEGTPVAILEASGAGLPIVSTKHAGIPDVIIDKKSGLLVEEGDVDAMALAMTQLADDFELARKLGSAGKEHIRQNFSMDRHIDILNQLIKKAVPG